MSPPLIGILLLTPVLDDVEAFLPAFEAALDRAEVGAVLLRLAAADERTLIKRIKSLAPLAQAQGAALVVSARDAPDLASVAIRGGADGVHAGPEADLRSLRDALKGERILGVGGLRTKHDAMEAGEAGADYVLFGEPRPDGWIPDAEATIERAEWWAEIFETPCAAFASSLDLVPEMAATGAEFVAVADAVWMHPDGPRQGVRTVGTALRRAGQEALA
jgi:thiamine-phosphate pyrophosphorylase